MRKKLWLFPALLCGASHLFAGAGEHFDKARELYRAGMWTAARTELQRARESIDRPQDPLVLRCDYLTVMCAAAAGEDNAMALAEGFLQKHPHTIYHNDVLFALAGELYRAGEWEQARSGYMAVDPARLDADKLGEYHFKSGHGSFKLDERESALNSLRQVGEGSAYSIPAHYYIAYVDYVEGRYAEAKKGFQSVAHDAAYAPIAPFYLLQIEFLQGNYRYVAENAERLINSSTRERARQTARVAAESWYHLGGHDRALEYMALYRSLDGAMGRQENYIEGYCLYMRGEPAAAAEKLGLATGPEDALAQNAAYHLAACYMQLGDKRAAMQSLSIAASGRFDEKVREEALFNYGKLQYELGGGVFNEAINVLNRYIKEYPASSRVDQAREYLISAYYNSRNYEAAYDAIMLIPDPDNDVKAALQKITYFRALEALSAGDGAQADRMLQLSAANRYNAKYTALAAFWRGEIAFRRGDYAGAIPLYRDFIAVAPASEPEYAAAHYALGYSYFNLKRWSEAGAWLARYIALRPADREFLADACNRAGDVKYSARSFWQAMEEWDRAIALGTPQRYYAQWRRAFTLGLVDRAARKVESLQAIVAEGKGEYVDEAMYELGRTYMGMERFADAASTLTRYIDTYPDGLSRVDALSDLGLTYQNMGQGDRALQYYKQIVSSAPLSSHAKDAVLGIRSIYVERGDVDSYFDYARGAGVEGDLSAMQRDSLSFAAARRQYMVGAATGAGIAPLRKYLDDYPRGAFRAQALSDLGAAHLRAGDRPAARQAWSELAGMHRNDYTVRALEQLSQMDEQNKDYASALGWYRALGAAANGGAAVNRAFEGALRMARHLPREQRGATADEILSSPLADKNVTRGAEFLKAGTLPDAQALQIYERLAVEVLSAEGAESSLRVIESLSAAGNNAAAKKRIFAMSEQNSPHAYWVGRAFLILGRIYVDEGDTFQARATFQSIVDGYPDPDDGIVQSAREAMAKLK